MQTGPAALMKMMTRFVDKGCRALLKVMMLVAEAVMLWDVCVTNPDLCQLEIRYFQSIPLFTHTGSYSGQYLPDFGAKHMVWHSPFSNGCTKAS